MGSKFFRNPYANCSVVESSVAPTTSTIDEQWAIQRNPIRNEIPVLPDTMSNEIAMMNSLPTPQPTRKDSLIEKWQSILDDPSKSSAERKVANEAILALRGISCSGNTTKEGFVTKEGIVTREGIVIPHNHRTMPPPVRHAPPRPKLKPNGVYK